MDARVAGRFADPGTEARYQRMARTLRQPFVRVYAGLVTALILAYGILNPLYVIEDHLVQVSLYSALTIGVLGLYVTSTFWDRYPEQPMVDFAALIALSLLVTLSNAILYETLTQLHERMHAVGTINRLVVTAFAAFALAGRVRLFIAWLIFDFAIFANLALHPQTPGPGWAYAAASYAGSISVMLMINFALEKSSRRAFALSEALDAERLRNEEMLHNVLPAAAAQRLKDGQMVADSYGDASVIFIDIVGFSTLAKRVSPGHLIDLLNGFFSLADRCAADCGVEKVKTIGDAYLAISGGNIASRNSAQSAIAFAEAVIDGLPEVRRESGIDVQIRVGIHSGPVVGGVIGETRMAYDYWGETMNIAARIEGTASPDGIAVSEACYLRTRGMHAFSEPETILLKGVGETLVYKIDPGAEAGKLAAAA